MSALPVVPAASPSSQKIGSWTYVAGPPAPNYSAGFNAIGLTLNGGATLNGTRLRVTDTNPNEARKRFLHQSGECPAVQHPAFNFQLTYPNADGFTFTIQGVGPTALGRTGGSSWLHWTLPAAWPSNSICTATGARGRTPPAYTPMVPIPTLPAINLSSDGDQSAQRRHLQRPAYLQRSHVDCGHHRHGNQRLGDADLHRQYPRHCRRHRRPMSGLRAVPGEQPQSRTS